MLKKKDKVFNEVILLVQLVLSTYLRELGETSNLFEIFHWLAMLKCSVRIPEPKNNDVNARSYCFLLLF